MKEIITLRDDEIGIKAELSVEQTVAVYNLLKPNAQQKFFGHLSNDDAKKLQTALRQDHNNAKWKCNCFGCIAFIE